MRPAEASSLTLHSVATALRAPALTATPASPSAARSSPSAVSHAVRRRWAGPAPRDGPPREPQRGPVVPLSGVARAEGQELERFVSVLQYTDQPIEAVHGDLAVEGQEEGLVDLAAELAVRGDVEDGVCALLQLLVEARDRELLVQQRRAPEHLPHVGDLALHFGERGEPLDRLRHSHRQDAQALAIEGPRVGELEARLDGEGVLRDQELLAVVERRHRDGAEGTVRHEDEGVDLRGLQVRLEGTHQPVVELPRGTNELAGCPALPQLPA